MQLQLNELDNPRFDISIIAQVILKKHYLIPFSPTEPRVVSEVNPTHFEIKDPRIPRVTHGAMHAARVAAYIKIIHLFRQARGEMLALQWAIRSITQPLSLTQVVHLIQLAGLFHDAAREDEGFDKWDLQSAQACLNFFRTTIPTLDTRWAILLSSTIAYKDEPEAYTVLAQQQGILEDEIPAFHYLRELIHDADCLDIMRVRSTFKMEFLCVASSKEKTDAHVSTIELIRSIRTLIHDQGDQYKDSSISQLSSSEPVDVLTRSFDLDRKVDYEMSDNVYNKIINDMHKRPLLKWIFKPMDWFMKPSSGDQHRFLAAPTHSTMPEVNADQDERSHQEGQVPGQ